MPQQRQPQRTPLTRVEEIGTHRGRRILAATYPSATSDNVWTVTFADDGHPIGCDCPAGRNFYPCWHQRDTGNAVVAFYKALCAPMTDDNLAKHAEHLARYLSYPQDQPDREAAEHELVAVMCLRAERAAKASAA
jgi:hypothetical protein